MFANNGEQLLLSIGEQYRLSRHIDDISCCNEPQIVLQQRRFWHRYRRLLVAATSVDIVWKFSLEEDTWILVSTMSRMMIGRVLYQASNTRRHQ